MNVLAIDIGGSHVKALASRRKTPIKFPSGPKMTPKAMVRLIREAVVGWDYAAVSIGYPGAVMGGKPVSEPRHLGHGWVGFNFAKAFGCPVKIINDAAMQALGSYRGGRMLFLGLGTGLGTALVLDGLIEPMELAHLPYKKGRSYEDYVGEAGLERFGKKRWRSHVMDVISLLKTALEVDDIVLGGGNARLLRRLPSGVRRGDNANAFVGGFRLWHDRPRGGPPSARARSRGSTPPTRRQSAG